MALPKLSVPLFELTLPSNNKTVKYRPFLVKEEKILLMAQSGQEPSEIINSVKQVINNCIVNSDINVDDLASFDLEYLFLKLRSKSVGNVIELTYRDLEDNKKYKVEVDLDAVEIQRTEGHTNKVEINSTTGLILKYPGTETSLLEADESEQSEVIFKVIGKCIESIYDENGVYNTKDYSEEEVMEFVSNLDLKSFERIQDFFTTMPKIFYEVKYTNSLGKEKVIPLTTLNDFFTLG
jgi:hypothetical protein